MDTIPLDRLSMQDQQVREMLANLPLPPSIVGYDVLFDETWDGEPGVWVMLHQPSGNERPEPGEVQAMLATHRNVLQHLRDVVRDREVYVRFVLPPGHAA